MHTAAHNVEPLPPPTLSLPPFPALTPMPLHYSCPPGEWLLQIFMFRFMTHARRSHLMHLRGPTYVSHNLCYSLFIDAVFAKTSLHPLYCWRCRPALATRRPSPAFASDTSDRHKCCAPSWQQLCRSNKITTAPLSTGGMDELGKNKASGGKF